jgi:hypothetical protein
MKSFNYAFGFLFFYLELIKSSRLNLTISNRCFAHCSSYHQSKDYHIITYFLNFIFFNGSGSFLLAVGFLNSILFNSFHWLIVIYNFSQVFRSFYNSSIIWIQGLFRFHLALQNLN